MGDRILVSKGAKLFYLLSNEYAIALNMEPFEKIIDDWFESNKLRNPTLGDLDNRELRWYAQELRAHFKDTANADYKNAAQKYSKVENELAGAVIECAKANDATRISIRNDNKGTFVNTFVQLLEVCEAVNKNFGWQADVNEDRTDANYIFYKKDNGIMSRLFSASPGKQITGSVRLSEIKSICSEGGTYFDIITEFKNYEIGLANK